MMTHMEHHEAAALLISSSEAVHLYKKHLIGVITHATSHFNNSGAYFSAATAVHSEYLTPVDRAALIFMIIRYPDAITHAIRSKFLTLGERMLLIAATDPSNAAKILGLEFLTGEETSTLVEKVQNSQTALSVLAEHPASFKLLNAENRQILIRAIANNETHAARALAAEGLSESEREILINSAKRNAASSSLALNKASHTLSTQEKIILSKSLLGKLFPAAKA